MHDVLGVVVALQRLKGAEADVQRQKRSPDAALAEPIEDSLSEVQPGGGRGDGA